MSESDTKPTVIKSVSDLIETRVEHAWQVIERGQKGASVYVALGDRHNIDFHIAAESGEGFLRRLISKGFRTVESPAKSWIIRLFPNFTPCPQCRRYIDSLSTRVFDKVGALEFVHHVVNQLRLSRCFETVDVPTREDEGGRIRLVAETPKPRIKILDSESSVSQASLPTASPVPTSVKIAKSAEISSPRSAVRITVFDRTREPQLDEVLPYSVPSIRYELASGEKVEVTIPLSICEKLIAHCSASRRHGREVGGILVGTVDERPSNRSPAFDYQAVVTDLIEVRSADSSGSHICFDENTWRNVNREMETKFEPKKRLRLGWYHTHPTQGIFFSAQDLVAHETFGKQFQFALVIDPRKMEAGLFFWKEGRGSSLGRTNSFMLARDEDPPTLPETRSEDETKVSDERGPLSGFRVLLSVLMALLALFFVAQNNPFMRVKPAHSCLLAFVAFLGLRMWNASFFHPVEPIESVAANKMAAGIVSGLIVIGRAVLRIPLIIRFPIVILLLAALSFFVLHLAERPIPDFAPPKPQSPVPGTQKNVTPPNTTVLKLSVTHDPDFSAVDIARLGDPPVKVSYKWAPREGNNEGGGRWYADPVSEHLFFKELFQWDIMSHRKSGLVSDLQTHLGLGVPDGLWGDSTRSALLNKIKGMSSEETLTVLVPGNKKVAVGFEKKAVAVASTSDVPSVNPHSIVGPPRTTTAHRGRSTSTVGSASTRENTGRSKGAKASRKESDLQQTKRSNTATGTTVSNKSGDSKKSTPKKEGKKPLDPTERPGANRI